MARGWIRPGSRTTLAEWVQRWWPSLDLDLRTLENYESYLRLHILPRFGPMAMGDITTLDINLWIKESGEETEWRKGYAPSTIRAWVNLLSMILTDAVDQRLIPANPVQKRRRRGRRSRKLPVERTWATPEEVMRIADQAGLLGGCCRALKVSMSAAFAVSMSGDESTPPGWCRAGSWCSECRRGAHSAVTSVTAMRAEDSSTMVLSSANAATRACRARLLTARG